MSAASILGVGACTPIGVTAASSAAAFRAGIVRFREIDDSAVEPIRASHLSQIPWGRSCAERTLELTRRALLDLLRSFPFDPASRLAAWIGIAEAEPEAAAVERALAGHLHAAFPGLVGPPTFLRHGRGAFFAALGAAQRALLARDCDLALVGAADSLCAPGPLERLARERRLLGPELEGVIPGEGAAFLLLARPGLVSRARGTLLCCATAREPRHRRQDAPNTAEALTAVFHELRAHPATQGRRADLLLTCETGEPFWTNELATAYLRNVPLMPEPFTRTTAAEGLGDLGAAGGAVMTAVGLCWLARPLRPLAPESPQSLLMVCGSSDDGHVGACLVEGTPKKEASR